MDGLLESFRSAMSMTPLIDEHARRMDGEYDPALVDVLHRIALTEFEPWALYLITRIRAKHMRAAGTAALHETLFLVLLLIGRVAQDEHICRKLLFHECAAESAVEVISRKVMTWIGASMHPETWPTPRELMTERRDAMLRDWVPKDLGSPAWASGVQFDRMVTFHVAMDAPREALTRACEANASAIRERRKQYASRYIDLLSVTDSDTFWMRMDSSPSSICELCNSVSEMIAPTPATAPPLPDDGCDDSA